MGGAALKSIGPRVIDATPMALGIQHGDLPEAGAQRALWHSSCDAVMVCVSVMMVSD